jgi:8-oxo-dGTP pyrophosphatase MutT (NUDIX family)
VTGVLAANSAAPAAFRKRPALDASQLADLTGHAAGIMFVAPDGDVLLLRRSAKEENFPGYWGFPGGGVDDGETPQIGAVREAKEEMGVDVEPDGLKPLNVKVTPTKKAFHTFAAPTDNKFVPTLNDEHSGYAWASLDMLPRPLHPAIEETLQTRLGVNGDMTPEDWAGLRDGFAKWTREEELEDGHATDSALRLAMDRDSVREKTRDGRLMVKRAHITKANVCPYRGAEIPGYQALGLDADRIYNLLRDPDELRKAASTSNGVQLLIKHVPVNANDHRPNETVGSLGTDAEFDGEYLDNSLFVNAQRAIDGIESGSQRELSAGYHYKPDMTPGNFRGTAYDGVMRDIVFNHVALVEDGRAGPDVVVGDSMENVMAAKKSTRLGAIVLMTTANTVAPALAMDAKIELPRDAFAALTTKNFKASKAGLLSTVRAAIDGKLRKGLALDATMSGLAKAIDAFEELENGADESASEEQHKAMEAAANGTSTLDIPKAVGEEFADADKGKTFDAEPFKSFLREKGMGEDDIMKACDMLPKPALDSDETPEEKAAREKKESDDKAAKDAEMKDMVSKPAMDAALQAHGEKIAKQVAESVTKSVRETERGIREALHTVKDFVGELPASMAFDSAAGVYRQALKMKGVANAETLHADALLPVLQAQPKIGAKVAPVISANSFAMDASVIDKATKLAPGLAGIQNVT